MEKFEIVVRAQTLAASHNTENSSSNSEQEKTKTIQFDESTWERISPNSDSDGSEGNNPTHRLPSAQQLEPDAAAFQSEVLQSVFSALQTLPEQEAIAIYARLGLDIKQQQQKQQIVVQKNNNNKNNELNNNNNLNLNLVYSRGMRRLKRQLQNKYPQFDLLSENIVQPLYQ